MEVKNALGRLQFVDRVKIESAPAFCKNPAFATEDKGAKFKARMHVGEKDFLILEIEEGVDASTARDFCKEFRRALVGGYSRRHQQTDDASRVNECRRALNK